MNRQVWKYPVALRQVPFALELPIFAQILTVAMQHSEMMMWASVIPDAATERRVFVWAGTGHDLPDVSCTYVGTVQDGVFVFHLFEMAMQS